MRKAIDLNSESEVREALATKHLAPSSRLAESRWAGNASVNAFDVSLLENACLSEADPYKVVSALLDAGAKPTGNELAYACEKGNVRCAEILLAHGAKADGKPGGLIPLQSAIIGRSDAMLDLVGALLSRGANPSKKDKQARTSLHYAVMQSQSLDLISLLLEADPSCLDREDADGATALRLAVKSGFLSEVRYLVACGANTEGALASYKGEHRQLIESIFSRCSGIAPLALAATPKAKAATPKAKAVTPKAKAATPKAKAVTPKAKEVTLKAKAVTPKKAATPKVAKAKPKSAAQLAREAAYAALFGGAYPAEKSAKEVDAMIRERRAASAVEEALAGMEKALLDLTGGKVGYVELPQVFRHAAMKGVRAAAREAALKALFDKKVLREKERFGKSAIYFGGFSSSSSAAGSGTDGAEIASRIGEALLDKGIMSESEIVESYLAAQYGAAAVRRALERLVDEGAVDTSGGDYYLSRESRFKK